MKNKRPILRKLLASGNLALLFSLLLSCGSGHNEKKGGNAHPLMMVEHEEVSFAHGMSINHRQCGVVRSDIETLVYFGNLSTYKRVKFFDLKGNFQHEAKVPQPRSQYEFFDDLEVISRDSILYFLSYFNQMLLCNAEGEIIRELDFNPMLKIPDSEASYTLYSSVHSTWILDDFLCLELGIPFEFPEDSILGIRSLDEMSFLHSDRKREQHKFYVCQDFLSDDLRKCRPVSRGFGKNYCGSDECVSAFNVYTVTDKEIVFCSVYKPMVYFLNRNTGEINDSINFSRSVKTEFLYPKKRVLGRISETESNENLKLKGFVHRIYWDSTSGQFYVTVSHARLPGEESKTLNTLFVFDENKKLRFRKEINGVKDTLNVAFMIPTPEGLLISSEFKTRPGRKEGTTRFRKFTFE